jgi:hypothetical protein
LNGPAPGLIARARIPTETSSGDARGDDTSAIGRGKMTRRLADDYPGGVGRGIPPPVGHRRRTARWQVRRPKEPGARTPGSFFPLISQAPSGRGNGRHSSPLPPSPYKARGMHRRYGPLFASVHFGGYPATTEGGGFPLPLPQCSGRRREHPLPGGCTVQGPNKDVHREHRSRKRQSWPGFPMSPLVDTTGAVHPHRPAQLPGRPANLGPSIRQGGPRRQGIPALDVRSPPAWNGAWGGSP